MLISTELPHWLYLTEYFEGFDPKKPKVSVDLFDVRNAENFMGHQQRNWAIFHCIKEHTRSKGGIGIDMGAGQVQMPFCITNDYYWGDKHPYYGGAYWPQVHCGAERIPIKDNTFHFLTSQHSLEHMRNTQATINEWVRIVKPGGALILVLPDAKFRYTQEDHTHESHYSAESFLYDVLEPLQSVTVEEYDTLKNYFSFNVLLRKK